MLPRTSQSDLHTLVIARPSSLSKQLKLGCHEHHYIGLTPSDPLETKALITRIAAYGRWRQHSGKIGESAQFRTALGNERLKVAVLRCVLKEFELLFRYERFENLRGTLRVRGVPAASFALSLALR